MNLAPLPITFEATIPETYLDSMGHMNVMWYTHLFSQSMGGLFKLIGMNREYFETHHTGSFALAQHFVYRKEIRVGEHVTLRCRVLGRSEKKLHVMNFMTKENNVLAATGEFLGAHIDMRTRRTAPFAPHISESIDRFVAELSALGWDAPVCGALQV